MAEAPAQAGNPLARVSESTWFVWSAHMLFLLPMSMYILHDVIDDRWRPLRMSRIWYTAYTALNISFAIMAIIYVFALLVPGDHAGAAEALIAIILNAFAALRVLRGNLINRMVVLLSDRFRLTVTGVRNRWAGPLAGMISSSFMDDDYPGECPRVRWGYLWLKMLSWRPVHRANQLAHTRSIIIDAHEFVLMIVIWAWHAYSQEMNTYNEDPQLWWSVTALDRCSVVCVMLNHGDEFRALEAKYRRPNIANLKSAVSSAYHPLQVKSPMIDQTTSGNTLHWVQPAFCASIQVVNVAMASMMGNRKISSSDPALNMKMGSGVVLVNDRRVQQGQEVKSVMLSCARGQQVLLMAEASRVRWWNPPAKDPTLRDAATIDRFVRDALLMMSKQRDMDAKDRAVHFNKQGRPVYSAWQARHLRRRKRGEGFLLDTEDAEAYFSSLGATEFDLSHVPAFLAAFCTCIACVLACAAGTSVSEQMDAVAKMPSDLYYPTGAPRLAFAALVGLQRQMARIWRTRLLQQQGPSDGKELRTTNTRRREFALENTLACACGDLLEVGERLLLHIQSMDGAGWMYSWEHVKSSVPAEHHAAVQQLIKLFHGFVHDMLTQSALPKDAYDLEDETLLTDCFLDNIAVMVALVFASTVCGCEAIRVSDKGSATRSQRTLEADEVTFLTAVHHAICSGWEYMGWQLQHSSQRTFTEEQVREFFPASMLEAWGIVGPVVDEESGDAAGRGLLTASAVAKLVCGRYGDTAGNFDKLWDVYSRVQCEVGIKLKDALVLVLGLSTMIEEANLEEMVLDVEPYRVFI